MTRPEILFPLFASVEGLPGVGAKTAALLGRIGAERVRDLLLLAPERLVDRRLRQGLEGVEPRTVATVTARIGEHRPPPHRRGPYRVAAEVGTEPLEIVHFNTNGDWMARLYPPGTERVLSGRVDRRGGIWQMAHPDHVLAPEEAGTIPDFEPVYPATEGLFQKVIAKAVAAALTRVPDLPEWLAADHLAETGW